MQFMIYIIDSYFSRMITLNTASQRLTFDSFSFFQIFLSHRFLSYYLFPNSYAQRNITSVICITYLILDSFCYVMYYIVSEICIGGYFLEDVFYCYYQQMKSGETNESLINR